MAAPNREAARLNPHMERFRRKGIEVLWLYEPVDEFVMDSLAKYKEWEFKSVETAADDALNDFADKEQPEHEAAAPLSEDESATFDALLEKMCEAAQSQQPKGVTERTQARADLPFVGKRRFNFSGGSGTAEFITIQSNGHTVVESCGSECSIDFEGPFTNPLKSQYGSYRVEAKRIFELDEKGQGKTCQKELGEPRDTKCSVELYIAQ